MATIWANREAVGPNDIYSQLHGGLTVDLIATGREQLMTCYLDQSIEEVCEANEEAYDFIPVISEPNDRPEQIIGLFHAARYHDKYSEGLEICDCYKALDEGNLIGADASILSFILSADTNPCRLVISGGEIVGLVSLSDLQRLPVRAALFALVTGLEITMIDAIEAWFPNDKDWLNVLSDNRKTRIEEEIEKSAQTDGLVSRLLFTQFCDKANIISKADKMGQSRKILKSRFDRIQEFRDHLAHANEYADTPEKARKTCATVRDILDLRESIARE